MVISICFQAWTLHENNRSLELDPTMTAFDETKASRIIGVALLCTQASPMLRPTMSRVAAMLAGDIDVGIVTAKPSYLTDWDFKDITNRFLNEDSEASIASKSQKHDNTTDQIPSPVNPNESMLHEITGEGRWFGSATAVTLYHCHCSSINLLIRFLSSISTWYFLFCRQWHVHRVRYQRECWTHFPVPDNFRILMFEHHHTWMYYMPISY